MRNPSTPARSGLERAIRQPSSHLQRTPVPSIQRDHATLPVSAQHAHADPATASPQGILRLQCLAGNQAVSGLLARAVQPRLVVGAAGDSYEQGAGWVAEHVLGMPEVAGPVHGISRAGAQAMPLAASITPLVRRVLDGDETEEDEMKGEGQAQGIVQRARREHARSAGFPAGRPLRQ